MPRTQSRTRQLWFFAIESGEWIALAGVFTALVSTVTATLLGYREASAARRERELDRSIERRAHGRRDALAMLTPVFEFLSDLEKVAVAANRDPEGVARYVQERTFQQWNSVVRPVLIGIEVSSSSADARAQARSMVKIVDDSIIHATFEIEFAHEELDDDAQVEATSYLIEAVDRLRASAEALAALVRNHD